MNKIINILFTIPLVWALASCYDDKGNYDYIELDKVTISFRILYMQPNSEPWSWMLIFYLMGLPRRTILMIGGFGLMDLMV